MQWTCQQKSPWVLEKSREPRPFVELLIIAGCPIWLCKSRALAEHMENWSLRSCITIWGNRDYVGVSPSAVWKHVHSHIFNTGFFFLLCMSNSSRLISSTTTTSCKLIDFPEERSTKLQWCYWKRWGYKKHLVLIVRMSSVVFIYVFCFVFICQSLLLMCLWKLRKHKEDFKFQFEDITNNIL